MKVIVAAIIFTLLPLVGLASDRSIEVRDRYGNLVETKNAMGTKPSPGTVTATSPELSDMKAKAKKQSLTVTGILSEQKKLIDKGDLQ